MPLLPTLGKPSSSSNDTNRLPLYSLLAERDSSVDESSSSSMTDSSREHELQTGHHARHRQPYPTVGSPAGPGRSDALSPPRSWFRPVMPTKARFLADFTLGFADGLTVPFALTAGLSSLGRTDTVVYAGVAEICAGSISMGIGGYLSARGDGAGGERRQQEDSCAGDEDGARLVAEEDAEKRCGESALPDAEGVLEYLGPLQLPSELFEMVLDHVRERPHISAALAARGEMDEDTRPCSPVLVGVSVSCGYLLGGVLPLFPYFFVSQVGDGLVWSFGICLVALFIFGFTKDFLLNEDAKQVRYGKQRGLRWADIRHGAWEGLQMVFLGGVAALAAVLCVRAFEGLREDSSAVSR